MIWKRTPTVGCVMLIAVLLIYAPTRSVGPTSGPDGSGIFADFSVVRKRTREGA